MHAVDRRSVAHVPMQGLQHQAVAAECDHDIGFLGRAITMELRELCQSRLCFGDRARDKGDLVISLRLAHEREELVWARDFAASSIHPDRSCRGRGARFSRETK
jgi:hypothetical protein